jgi:hypothetical protein
MTRQISFYKKELETSTYPSKFESYTYVDLFPHKKSGCDVTLCNALSIPTTNQAPLKKKKLGISMETNISSLMIHAQV